MARAPRFDGIDVPALCAWMRACADAQPAAMLASHRRLIEQAIQSAEHPPGMSTHDGKARIDASVLRRMLAIIDSSPAVRQAEPKEENNVWKQIIPDDVPQAEPKRGLTCLWSRADDDTDTWETACRHAFTIIEGGPTDNQMAFCCYCGRPVDEEIGGSDAD